MAESQARAPVVPESVLKKQKRSEEWALKKNEELATLKKKNAENRKLIFNRAKLYTKEYEEQVTAFALSHLISCYVFCQLQCNKFRSNCWNSFFYPLCSKRSWFS